MIYLKTDEEIELMRENALLVSKTLAEVAKHIAPGVQTIELNKLAEEFIRAHGAEPGFLGYNGFPYSLCISVNSVVVHGFPSEYRLQDGDIISVDCGTKMKGFYGDSAYTFEVGTVTAETRRLLTVTKESLFKGIEQVKTGNRMGDVSWAIQHHAETYGYSVVRELIGHGIGHAMHERPDVPNYGKKGSGVKLQNGLVFCIEPMINAGKKEIVQERDGWTIRTADRKNSAHYELTVAVKDGKADVLSTFEFVEQVLKSKQN